MEQYFMCAKVPFTLSEGLDLIWKFYLKYINEEHSQKHSFEKYLTRQLAAFISVIDVKLSFV